MYFYQELRHWITKVIRQRQHLIKQGRSHKDSQLMAENIEYLTRHLDYYPYESNLRISGFFQRNRHRILSLLPGEGSGVHDKRMEEFGRYDRYTRKVVNDYPGTVSGSNVCALNTPSEGMLPSFPGSSG